jgi:hypothetical protein
LFGKLTDIRSLGTSFCQLIEQLLDPGEIFQFYLLNQQDIHLSHHVHRLQQVLAVIAVFLEERIEAMMDIILEISAGGYFRKNVLNDVLMVMEYLIKRIWS